MKKIFSLIFRVNPLSISVCCTLLVVILFIIDGSLLGFNRVENIRPSVPVSRSSKKTSTAVVMAVIDEKSLDEQGRWPWPRSKIAALVNALNKGGVKVIGFDIGFLEPDQNSNLRLFNQLEGQINDLNIKNNKLIGFIKKGKAEADNDLALANAIKNSSAAVVLGYFFHTSQASLEYQIAQEEIDRRLVQNRTVQISYDYL